MTDISLLNDSLKRRVAVPGDFDTVFPNTTEDDITGLLMDGFARAQLDGYFNRPAFAMDDNGQITPDITRAHGALIVLYAGVQMVQTQLVNTKSRASYRAGNVEYSTEQGTTVLTTALKQLEDEKLYLQQIARQQGVSAAFLMADAYFIKAVGVYPGHSYGVELDRAYDYHSPWPLVP